MKSKYETIKELHDKVSEIRDAELLKEVPNMLESWDIKIRMDDGILSQINISNPADEIYVVGLRYTKNDGTLTEDIFEFNPSTPNSASKYYKGKYERERPEYKGTHKKQDVSISPFTSVNSCSLFVGNKNDN